MPKQPEKFNKGAIIIYQPKIGGPRLEVELKEETVWLTQSQMAELFGKTIPTINEHIKNLFSEGELAQNSVIRKFRITAADGKEYVTNFYNLDVIISVGYRVKSKQGTEFRIWATKVLKDYLIKGYTLNQKRLKETNLMDLEQAVALVKNILESKKLKGAEARGLLEVITKYANSWLFKFETFWQQKVSQKLLGCSMSAKG